MAFTSADMDAILATAGTTATIGTDSIRIIWRRRYRAITLVQATVESSEPYALAKASDVAELDVDHGTELEIDSETWKVVEIQPEITGFTRLIFELQ